MRIRYLKRTEEILQNSAYILAVPSLERATEEGDTAIPAAPEQPAEPASSLATILSSGRPLWIEIGCGKGKFILEMAKAHPEVEFIGIEKLSTILARAVLRLEGEEAAIPNLHLMRISAEDLLSVFPEGSVERIYLNFSDPWPKDKHAKRRLTSDRFLPIYAKLLTPDGELRFKTDNDNLFTFSLESLAAAGWDVLDQTCDLHHSELNAGNITTEYEDQFSAAGKSINYLRAKPQRPAQNCPF